MASPALQLYLASSSPRRRQILSDLGLCFALLKAEIDETPRAAEVPVDYVKRMAEDKARAGLKALGSGHALPVLGADTAVVSEGVILGKPQDRQDAARMLTLLSARWHEVMSAVCLMDGQHHFSTVSVTRVKFKTLDADEIRAYWDTGEPADKAGAYGIQGLGSLFVERIEGSYSGVVGLPVSETIELLAQFGITTLHLLKSHQVAARERQTSN